MREPISNSENDSELHEPRRAISPHPESQHAASRQESDADALRDSQRLDVAFFAELHASFAEHRRGSGPFDCAAASDGDEHERTSNGLSTPDQNPWDIGLEGISAADSRVRTDVSSNDLPPPVACFSAGAHTIASAFKIK